MRDFYLSKSTGLYDLNLILIYRMFVVIWLFLAKRAAYKFVAPCIAWIAQRRRNSSWQYFYTSVMVSASSVTSRCIFNTTSKYVVHYHVLFMNTWCLYSSSVKQSLLSVNRDQFLRQLKDNGRHKTTFHSTGGWESSLGKIYHRNCTVARTGTWNPARATKKTSSYIEWPLSPRLNKRGNKAKWLWNTCFS